jgi:hypothetical protein
MTRAARFPVRRVLSLLPHYLSASRVMVALAAIVVLAAFAFDRPKASFRGSRFPAGLPTLRTAKACPLTRSEELNAVEKFKKLLPVLQHPRCLNCHGGVNPFVEKEQGGHLGGAISQAAGFIKQQKTCQECHSELPGWELPPEDFFFVGKDARQLCMQLKKFNPVPKFLVGHLDNDNGKGPPFTMTAFKGDRALNDMAKDMVEEETHRRFFNQPPPISHDEFVARAQAWVDAMGDGYVVPPDCGCKPSGSAWVGTLKARFELRTTELGVYTETADATIRLVIDSSYDTTDDPAQYWKSVSGNLNWTASNSGSTCRINSSGTLQINIGGDQNPLVNLREEQGDAGGLKFSMGLGPWPDAYQPRVPWRCPDHTIVSTLMGVYTFWHYDIAAGLLSPDSKTLKGSFQASLPGGGSHFWEWDLHLEP